MEMRIWIQRLYRALESLGVKDPLMQDRKEHASHYQEAYKENKKTAYAQKKMQSVHEKYQLDTHSSPMLYKQIVDVVKQRLSDALYRLVATQQKKLNGALPAGALYSWKITKLIHQTVIFKPGLYSYMKAMIPDEHQRKEFWHNVKKESWQHFLKGLKEKLMNPETMEHAHLILLRPTIYQLKKA